MLAEIESLLVLQDRDQHISKLKADLKRIPNLQESAKHRLSNDLAAVEASKKSIQENELAIKGIELDIGTRKDTLLKLKKQQYETKKNEEFTALGNEIVRYDNDVDQLETSELELMEKADSLSAAHQKTTAALKLTQELVDEEITALDKRKTECESRLNEVLTERTKIAAEVDEELLSLYDRLITSKGGNAIVAANKEQCSGCHMKLVPATLIKVRAEQEITQCENCGRILHL